jgi:hypothetical protein
VLLLNPPSLNRRCWPFYSSRPLTGSDIRFSQPTSVTTHSLSPPLITTSPWLLTYSYHARPAGSRRLLHTSPSRSPNNIFLVTLPPRPFDVISAAYSIHSPAPGSVPSSNSPQPPSPHRGFNHRQPASISKGQWPAASVRRERSRRAGASSPQYRNSSIVLHQPHLIHDKQTPTPLLILVTRSTTSSGNFGHFSTLLVTSTFTA